MNKLFKLFSLVLTVALVCCLSFGVLAEEEIYEIFEEEIEEVVPVEEEAAPVEEEAAPVEEEAAPVEEEAAPVEEEAAPVEEETFDLVERKVETVLDEDKEPVYLDEDKTQLDKHIYVIYGENYKVANWPSATSGTGSIRVQCIKADTTDNHTSDNRGNEWATLPMVTVHFPWNGTFTYDPDDEDEPIKYVAATSDPKFGEAGGDPKAVAFSADFYDIEKVVPPTCTKEGSFVLKSQYSVEANQGIVFTRTLAKDGDQVIDEEYSGWSGNCTVTKTVVLPKLPHTFTLEEVVKEPSCSEEGASHPKCAVCGYVWSEKDQIIEALPHDYKITLVTVPTCLNEGKYQFVCSICGDKVDVNKDDKLEAKVFDEDGKYYYDDDDDEAYYEVADANKNTLKKTDHDLGDFIFDYYEDEDDYPTCEEGEGDADDKEKLATFEETQNKEDLPNGYGFAHGYQICKVCGQRYETVSAIPRIDHSFEMVMKVVNGKKVPDGTEPTCDTEGEYQYKCSKCDKVETRAIPALGHIWTDWEPVNTYNQDGLDTPAYWIRKCTREGCGAIEQKTVLDDSDPNVDPTPTEEKIPDGLNEDGKVYKDGEVDTTAQGIKDYNGGRFFVDKGEICKDANGLAEYGGTWYFLSNGQIQTQYTGFAEYDGNWFVIKKGVLDETVEGIYDYDGGKFVVSSGWLRKDITGLVQIGDDWYFVSQGQVQDVTSLVLYDGAWFYVVDGKLAVNFTGDVTYDGGIFHVVKGQLY